MSARAEILAAIRQNRPSGDFPDVALPRFMLPEGGGLQTKFVANLKAMGGSVLEADPGLDVIDTLGGKLKAAGLVCSMVPEIVGTKILDGTTEPRDLADVDIAVVRAVLGVAETGSVLFTERELGINTVAYLAQHLVVLVDPEDIVDGLQSAYDHPDFRNAGYAVFHTGPSATGDIEGVLIHGAQGVRSLTVAFVSRRSVDPAILS